MPPAAAPPAWPTVRPISGRARCARPGRSVAARAGGPSRAGASATSSATEAAAPPWHASAAHSECGSSGSGWRFSALMRIGSPASPSTRTSHRPTGLGGWPLSGGGWPLGWKLLATPRRPLSSGRALSPASVTRRPSSDASVGGATGCSSCTHSASRLGPLSTGKRGGEAGAADESGEAGVAGVAGVAVGGGATPWSAAATRRAACSVARVCPPMPSVIDAAAPSVTCCPASHASSSARQPPRARLVEREGAPLLGLARRAESAPLVRLGDVAPHAQPARRAADRRGTEGAAERRGQPREEEGLRRVARGGEAERRAVPLGVERQRERHERGRAGEQPLQRAPAARAELLLAQVPRGAVVAREALAEVALADGEGVGVEGRAQRGGGRCVCRPERSGLAEAQRAHEERLPMHDAVRMQCAHAVCACSVRAVRVQCACNTRRVSSAWAGGGAWARGAPPGRRGA
eukprot:scaffold15820_cov56-Phaeocystis_antarctica.AAC.2